MRDGLFGKAADWKGERGGLEIIPVCSTQRPHNEYYVKLKMILAVIPGFMATRHHD